MSALCCSLEAALSLTSAGLYTLAVQLSGEAAITWNLEIAAQSAGPLSAIVTYRVEEVRPMGRWQLAAALP